MYPEAFQINYPNLFGGAGLGGGGCGIKDTYEKIYTIFKLIKKYVGNTRPWNCQQFSVTWPQSIKTIKPATGDSVWKLIRSPAHQPPGLREMLSW